MQFKMTILTPVHIATGNKKPSFLYNRTNNNLKCYNFEELLKQIPVERFFSFNSNHSGKKDEFNNLFKDIDYNLAKESYKLRCFENNKKDVSEQIKALTKPIIPGSTLKGTLIRPIIYKILKQNNDKIISILNDPSLNKEEFDKQLFNKLFDNNFDAMFKLFSSCLICHDLCFSKMILCKSLRLNISGKYNKCFECLECIDIDQAIIDEFIKIDEINKDYFTKKVAMFPQYKILLEFLEIDNLMQACCNYYEEIIEDDKKYFIDDIYSLFIKNKFDQRDQIIDYLENLELDDKNSIILRLGNSTNYFYKTVTMFIKKYHNDFYRQNFELIFMPVKLKGKPRALPNYKTMPKTRTVLVSGKKYYLGGFVKIEKC